jgi:predicted amidohydrolase
MGSTFKVACVQTTTGPDVATNIEHASGLINDAAKAGANLIVLPEVVNVMDLNRKDLATKTVFEDEDTALKAFRLLAAKLDIWLLIGSLVIKHTALDDNGNPKFANRSFMIDNTGEVTARYDKIHMFDVDLDDGESYRESNAYEPGSEAVLTDTPWGKLGMTICYDLRFPYLYRHLAHEGAKFLAIPAAFTRPTGKAHWHVLMRARAIENGCFVFAAAQCGDHGEGRLTYGHSIIVDPWGEVLADGGEQTGFAIAEIDVDQVEAVRAKVPSLSNDRPFN